MVFKFNDLAIKCSHFLEMYQKIKHRKKWNIK